MNLRMELFQALHVISLDMTLVTTYSEEIWLWRLLEWRHEGQTTCQCSCRHNINIAVIVLRWGIKEWSLLWYLLTHTGGPPLLLVVAVVCSAQQTWTLPHLFWSGRWDKRSCWRTYGWRARHQPRTRIKHLSFIGPLTMTDKDQLLALKPHLSPVHRLGWRDGRTVPNVVLLTWNNGDQSEAEHQQLGGVHGDQAYLQLRSTQPKPKQPAPLTQPISDCDYLLIRSCFEVPVQSFFLVQCKYVFSLVFPEWYFVLVLVLDIVSKMWFKLYVKDKRQKMTTEITALIQFNGVDCECACDLWAGETTDRQLALPADS